MRFCVAQGGIIETRFYQTRSVTFGGTLEGSILLALQSIRVDGLTQLLALLSALGGGSILWVVIALLMLLFEEQRQNGIILIIVLIASSAAGGLLAAFIARTCPADSVVGLVGVMGVSKDGYCMPSLHAATSFATAYVIWRGAGKGPGAVVYFLAVLICFARMYLGVAYPSDILAGVVLGTVIAVVLFAIFAKLFQVVNIQPRAPQRKRVNKTRGSHSR